MAKLEQAQLAAQNVHEFFGLECMVMGAKMHSIGVALEGEYAKYDASPEQQAAKEKAKIEGRMFFPAWSTPLLTSICDPNKELEFAKRFTRTCKGIEEINALFQEVITEAPKMGLFPHGSCGHVIKAACIRLSDSNESILVKITGVFKKTLDTATAASDLMYVVKGTTKEGVEKHLLVAGTRLADPGKGKFAIFGGFRDIDKNGNFETGVKAALREGKEEGGITLNLPDLDKLDYDFKEAKGTASLRGKKDYPCTLKYVGTIPTSDAPIAEGGERFPDGSKRVHITSGYVAVVDVGADYDDIHKDIDNIFKAGDDISKINTFEMGDKDPEFGIKHHAVLYQKMKDLITTQNKVVDAANAALVAT